MPASFSRTQTDTAVGIVATLAELRARIEERRKHLWSPEPGDTAQDRKLHWQEIADRHAVKVEAGECIGDELLPQLRDNKAMTSLAREFLTAAERGNAPMLG